MKRRHLWFMIFGIYWLYSINAMASEATVTGPLQTPAATIITCHFNPYGGYWAPDGQFAITERQITLLASPYLDRRLRRKRREQPHGIPVIMLYIKHNIFDDILKTLDDSTFFETLPSERRAAVQKTLERLRCIVVTPDTIHHLSPDDLFDEFFKQESPKEEEHHETS